MRSFMVRISSTYIILLLILLHNIFRYLIRQQKYKQMHLSLFYGISTVSTAYKIMVNLCFYNDIEIIGREPNAFFYNVFSAALLVQQMTTFFEPEASFEFYTKSLGSTDNSPKCAEAQLRQTLRRIRIKMVIYFMTLALFFGILFIIYGNFLTSGRAYMILDLFLISFVYLTFAIKLVCCFYRIYKSFKRAFNDKL